jgi:hypothetical protein
MSVPDLDCGALRFTDEKIRDSLKERLPETKEEIDSMAFGEVSRYALPPPFFSRSQAKLSLRLKSPAKLIPPLQHRRKRQRESPDPQDVAVHQERVDG